MKYYLFILIKIEIYLVRHFYTEANLLLKNIYPRVTSIKLKVEYTFIVWLNK